MGQLPAQQLVGMSPDSMLRRIEEGMMHPNSPAVVQLVQAGLLKRSLVHEAHERFLLRVTK
ncbi:MAG TPA: hypothetical protein VGQ00_01895 [Candidatus Norongarragalinales archaeon]|jgi:hypothetical protein|nr:hypothetical protein [Candidatus Norongarragalinales archaeon]